MPELIMIFVVVLLLFGAKKLPELARGVGKSMGEFKKAREEFEHEITRSENEVRRDEKSKEKQEITRSEDEVRRDEKSKEVRVKPVADKESHDA